MLVCAAAGEGAFQCNTARGGGRNGLQCVAVPPQAHSGGQKCSHLSSGPAPHVVGREGGKMLGLRQLVAQGLTPPVLLFVSSKERAEAVHR